MDALSQWSQIVVIVLLSIFKYGIGIFSAINSSIGFWPSILVNLIGGGIGILLFIHFGYWITKKYYDYKFKKDKYKRFSWWNRFLVNVKRKFGLIGIAIFSPILLTIPVGVMLALQITANKYKIFRYIFGGCIFYLKSVYRLEFSTTIKTLGFIIYHLILR
jgi:hypothetical protein